MRIILLIVFYIVAYVARVTDGETVTIPGHSLKRFLKQKVKAIRRELFETPPENEITQKAIKHSTQSLLENRIDNLLQNREILDKKLMRVRRSLRERTKLYTKDVYSNVAYRNNVENDNDSDEDDILSNVVKLRELPVWQIPEPTTAYPSYHVSSIKLDVTTNPMTTHRKIINGSLLTLPWNLNSDNFLKFYETILPMYTNSQEAFDELSTSFPSKTSIEPTNDGNQRQYRSKIVLLSKSPIYILNYPDKYINILKKNLIFSKISDHEYTIKPKNNDYIRRPIFEKINNKLVPVYPERFVNMKLLNFSQPRSFQWQFNRYQKTLPSSYNIKKKLFNNHLISSNRKFLLVPISNDSYGLENVFSKNAQVNTNTVTTSKQRNLLGRNKDNAMSEILSFKAHMHHSIKDVGKAYSQEYSNKHHLSEHNANDLHSDFNSGVFEENTTPTENSMPLLYPGFVYPAVAFQAYPNSIGVVPEVPDKTIVFHISDYKNISSVDSDINLSTSPFFDISDNDVLPYRDGSLNNVRLDVSSVVKTDEINPFQLDRKNYEKCVEYSELNVEDTTVAFRGYFSTLDNDINTTVTFEENEIYSLNNGNEMFDITHGMGDASTFSTTYTSEDTRTMDLTNDIVMQYMPSFDASKHNSHTLSPDTYLLNIDNVLNNQDINSMYEKNINDNYQQSIALTSIKYDNKGSNFNKLNYENGFINETFFTGYTTNMNSFFFLNTKDYTTSESLLSDIDEWSLKKEQFNTIQNPRALLMAIKPLSLELQKLQNAVRLVNESISNVQDELRIKKNIELVRMEQENKEKKNANTMNQKNKNFVDKITNNIASRKRTTGYFLFLDKLTTTFNKSANSNNDLRVQNNHRNFLKNNKLNEKRFLKFNNIKRHKLPYLRLNRSLKSLTNNYEMQVKSVQPFARSRLKKMTRMVTPALTLSYLIKNDMSRKSHFLNKCTPQLYNNFTFLSANMLPTFSNILKSKSNRIHLPLNAELGPEQRDAKRAISKEMYNPDKEKIPYGVLLPDVPAHREATAYLDILRLLNVTDKPYIEYFPEWTTLNMTETLLFIFTTTELPVTTKAFLPYLIEKTMVAVLNATTEKETLLEMTESVLYEHKTHAPDLEYYIYGTDYDERNYTRIYEDYDYEDQKNVISWHDYVEKITTETEEINITTIKYLLPELIFNETTTSIKITEPRTEYDIVMERPMETIIWYTTVGYQSDAVTLITRARIPTITSEIGQTISMVQLPTMLTAITSTIQTMQPPFYTTQLSTFTFNEIATLSTEIIAEGIVTEALTTEIAIEETKISMKIPVAEEFTTESAIILTPFVEGLTDITLKITIPTVTETLIEQTPLVFSEIVTIEEEIMTTIMKSTPITLTTEITPTSLIETSKLLYVSSTASIFRITEVELTIPITTPIVPILTLTPTKRRKLMTEEMTSVTESTFVITTITPITESAIILDESTTLHRFVISKITYITKIETEIEETAPFTIRTSMFKTRVPITKIIEKSTLLAEEVETMSPEVTTIKMPGEMTTTSAEALTQLTAFIEITTTSSMKEVLYSTSVDKSVEMFTSLMEEISTYVTTATTVLVIQSALTSQITGSTTTKTLIEPTTASEITVITHITTIITSSAIISQTEEVTLSTSTEAVTFDYSIPEEEGQVTQIEKTTVAEETTITETSIISTMYNRTFFTNEITSLSTTVSLTKELTSISIIKTIKTMYPITTSMTLNETIFTAISVTPFLEIIENMTSLTAFITTSSVKDFLSTSLVPPIITSLSIGTSTTLNQTTATTILTTETIESTSISSITFATTTLARMHPTTLYKLTTTLLPLIANTTLSAVPYTTASTIFWTEEAETATSLMMLVTTTISSLETSLTPSLMSSPITLTLAETSTILSEMIFGTTPTILLTEAAESTISSIIPVVTIFSIRDSLITPSILTTATPLLMNTTTTSTVSIITRIPFLTEGTTVPIIIIASSVEMFSTTSTLSSFTTMSTTETFPTTLYTMMDMAMNTTASGMIVSTITIENLESTISSIIYSTTMAPSIAEIAITTPIILDTSSYITISTSFATTILLTRITLSLMPEISTISSLKTETTETVATTSEIIPVSLKTISEIEEFITVSTIESSLIACTTQTLASLFTEMTVLRDNLSSIVTTEETSEVETEYYEETEPLYEEEYEEYEEEEYDTEIPTDKWYDYEERGTTMKRRTTMTLSTIKYTKLSKETVKSSTLRGGTITSPQKIETSEFTTISSLISMITLTYVDMALNMTTSTTSYEEFTDKELSITSVSPISLSTIFENVTAVKMETESTAITSEEETSVTINQTFGSTEEYILPSSKIFELKTKPLPLEYPTISAKQIQDTESTSESLPQTLHEITLPKFLTKPEEIFDWLTESEKIEKTDTTTERGSTAAEITMEVLTSFFISSIRSTISEEEAMGIHVTTRASTTLSDFEEELTTYMGIGITTESTKIVSESEFTETSRIEDVEQEEQKKQLLQRLHNLKKYEREMAEREERLKEKERQWNRKKEKCSKIMQGRKEEENNVTIVADTTTSYVITTAFTNLTATVIDTDFISIELAENLTIPSITTIAITFPIFDTEVISTLSISLYEITETSIETTIPYTTKESISTIYTIEETEETTTSYATEESTSLTYTTETTEESSYLTSYIAADDTLYTTTFSIDLYDMDLTSVGISTFYITEAVYTTNITVYSSYIIALTSPVISIMDRVTTLSSSLFSVSLYESSLTSVETTTPYTIEKTYTTELYTKSIHISSTLPFISPTISTINTTLSISTVTEIEYNEEIERLKEELLRRERELEKKEKMLLEKERKLEKEIAEFKRYMEEVGKEDMSILSSQESVIPISLSTPIPPIEETMKMQVMTRAKKITKKDERRVTVSAHEITEIKTVQEKEQTKEIDKYIPEEIVTTVKEAEIVTKRICLNVPENATVSLDKGEKKLTIRKVCLPYLPDKDEKKRPIGRLSRKLFTFQEARKTKLNFLADRLYRKRKMTGTTRKISNLQLLHHEWFNKESTKPMQHFKGFTRIYEKTRGTFKTMPTIISVQRNITNAFQGKSSLYDQRIFNCNDSFFQAVTGTMLKVKEWTKRTAFFKRNLNFEKKNNLFNNDIISSEKENTVLIKKNTQSSSRKNITSVQSRTITISDAVNVKEGELYRNKNRFYTVNVLHLGYNENEETHEVISIKPNKNELTNNAYELDDNEEYNNERDFNYVTESEKSVEITKSYHKKVEEKDNIKEKDTKLSSGTGKEIEAKDEYDDDITENHMRYKESAMVQDDKSLDNGDEDKRREKEIDPSGYAWPTERSTEYHLGGTRFWELEFDVTESSVVLESMTDKRIYMATDYEPFIKTTCLDVVLKNKRNDNTKIKRDIRYYEGISLYSSMTKMDVYNNGISEYDTSTEKLGIILKHTTRKNTLSYDLKINQPSLAVMQHTMSKELKQNLQRLRGLNSYDKGSTQKSTMKSDIFNYTGNNDLIMMKGRKLCTVNENNSKHQIDKYKNIRNDRNNKKKKESNKSNINLHTLKTCTNICNVDKQNSNKHDKETIKRASVKDTAININNKKNYGKVVDRNIIANHENKSIPVSQKGKIHDCVTCMCDLVDVIKNIKSILNKISFPLDEIKALNCSKYKETQNEIIISMDSDMEEAKAFPQPHYNTELLKGQKYMKLERLEDDFKSDLELENDHDIISLPGVNLNVPCNQGDDDITWLSSISRPSYTWKRMDGTTLFGFVAENGDLELRNINAKDTGNYTCVMTYTGPDNEEPVEISSEVNLQVMTLPRYILYGENRYYIRSCEERNFDILVTYLPLKLNTIICEADICNAYVLTPFCSRNQITINVLIVPSHVVKLMTIDLKRCNLFCLKAIQDKLSLLLSKNLHIFLSTTILFRLPHLEQRLVPITGKSSFARWKRGKTSANPFGRRFNNIGLFSGCPAGYGLRGTHCVPCTMGFYSEDGISHCKKCPSGTYQPNYGARVCRACSNPLAKGCYNMLWNSFSAIMVTLASLGAMLSIFLLILWIICCAKKKLCVKHIASIALKGDTVQQEAHLEEQPLMKNVSENEDQQWDNEHRAKKKKRKFYVNKRRHKQNEKKKYEKIHIHENEWGSHRIKDTPIICPDSYRSHEGYNDYYPRPPYLKRPRLPECDFDT